MTASATLPVIRAASHADIAAITTEAGFRQMIAVIGDPAQLKSIQPHRLAGFHFAGTYHAVGYKHGRWLDTVLMQRTLGPGDTMPPVDQR